MFINNRFNEAIACAGMKLEKNTMTTSKQYLMKSHLMVGNVIVKMLENLKMKIHLMFYADITEKLVLTIEYMVFVITQFNKEN